MPVTWKLKWWNQKNLINFDDLRGLEYLEVID